MLFLLDSRDPGQPFPAPELAESEPNGLLAMGGDLQPERLLNAYRQGIFPWFSQGQPPLWWSPDPRWVLFPQEMHLSRSLRRRLRRTAFRLTADQAFDRVIGHCATRERPGQDGTWILPQMQSAYLQLHHLGYARSIECWLDGELVGGLYGVWLGGGLFFGESMFSLVADASKAALYYLCRHLQGHPQALIDCQVYSGHLQSLGARPIPRRAFLQHLRGLPPNGRSEWAPLPQCSSDLLGTGA